MATYRRTIDLPEVIPVFPLDGVLLLPGGVLPLRIFEPRYLNMVDDAMSGGRVIGMLQTAPGGTRMNPALAAIGCAGRITSYSETGDGIYMIALTGLIRFETGEELPRLTPYRQVRPSYARFEHDLAEDEAEEFDRSAFLGLLRRYLDGKGLSIEWEAVAAAPGPALISSLSMALPFDPAEKQALLEADDPDARRATLEALLAIDAALSETSGDEEGDASPTIQ
ncbi:MAG TPA: LON peptidase substrate-binding domain-containing protein [Caulobacteraceae bacterium]|nr:LON peptidase substrate-binding domain-containing protein [Caulobacteraceae bacterium]